MLKGPQKGLAQGREELPLLPERARSEECEGAGKLSFTARIERPPLCREGSASKKGGCLPPRILLIVRAPGAREAPRALAPVLSAAPSASDVNNYFVGVGITSAE